MVHGAEKDRVGEYWVDGNRLMRGKLELANFPTPICELATCAGKIFVILHPWPIDEHLDYAATNLWALRDDGSILWKAQNINEYVKLKRPANFYRGLSFFDQQTPKIFVLTFDDKLCPLIDIETGRIITSAFIKVPLEDFIKIGKQVFLKSTIYLLALPHDPPSKSQMSLN